MTNANIREVHKLLDSLFDNSELSHAQIELIRGLVPELPKQKTLEELRHEVYDAWIGADGNDWPDDAYGVLETWLAELHQQLQGLKDTPAALMHPEFLETEADYNAAPEGTIVVADGGVPCHKFQSTWSSVAFVAIKDNRGMSRARRRVLRWGK